MNTTSELIYFPTWTAGRKGYSERIVQIFDEYHHQKGLRMTDQRLAILKYLLDAEKHVSQDEIYQALKSKEQKKMGCRAHFSSLPLVGL